MAEPHAIHSIADTALWVAYFRAQESRRKDCLFVDRFAERLAGERGFQIASTLPGGNKQEWAWVMRTYLFDTFLMRSISNGADLVLNLAAGLDARPYRLDVPASLHWIDVDLPEIIEYKQAALGGESARCHLERVPLDLTDLNARRAFFHELDAQYSNIAVLTEGLLIYLSPEDVARLAGDLSFGEHFRWWIIDLTSVGQLRIMQRSYGKDLGQAGAAFKFAPPDGPAFFTPHGWSPIDVRGMLKTAAELNRAPRELLALLPEPERKFGGYPWTGVCLLENRRLTSTTEHQAAA